MRKLMVAGALVWGLAGTAAADTSEVGDVMIHEPWVRASLGAAPNSAAYMTLEILGAEPDRLLGGSSPAATGVELHTHIMDGGVARMRPVDAIELAPGAPTVLEPGGPHLMLVGLTRKLEEGGTMPLTLVFETAGEITLEVPIKGVTGGGGHGAMQHGPPKTN